MKSLVDQLTEVLDNYTKENNVKLVGEIMLRGDSFYLHFYYISPKDLDNGINNC